MAIVLQWLGRSLADFIPPEYGFVPVAGKGRKKTPRNTSPRKSSQKREAGKGERFLVTHRDILVESIDAAIASLRDIIEMLGTDFDREGEGGFGAQDMAVWWNGRLLAVVRRKRGGRRKATVFDDVTSSQSQPSP
jgi:hypothetical protein